MATAPLHDDEDDFPVTDAMRAYLSAFDDFLASRTRSDRMFARSAMSSLCDTMMRGRGVRRAPRGESLTTDDLFGTGS